MNSCPALRAALLLLLLLCGSPASAMSVVPPTFPELVAESAKIVHARVTDVTSRKVTNSYGEIIKTFVTFEVTSTIKGPAEQHVTVAFLGGEVGDEGMSIPGMPTFQVGGEEFLFITAEQSICPLVGAMHGRYHVFKEPTAGRSYVARNDGSALLRATDVVRPMTESRTPSSIADASAALTPEAFEQLVAAEVARTKSGGLQR